MTFEVILLTNKQTGYKHRRRK